MPRQTGRYTDATSRARRIENRGPGEIPPGYALCDCEEVRKVTKTGRTSRHKTTKGYECSGSVGHKPYKLDELPPVKIPDTRVRVQKPRAASTAFAVCRECSKPLYGNRTLCGACSVRLGR